MVAMALVIAVGAGITPARSASALVAELGSGPAGAPADVLPPAAEEPKADELREPSGIEAAESKSASVRKPTVIKPKPKPKPAPAPKPAATAVDTSGWKSAKVSWYGPGFYGNTMAGGGTLTPSSMVVAHRSLAFGTKIEFSYNGRTCVAVVQDRGPFIASRIFDLGPGTAKALGFSGVGTVKYRIL
ncbi:MAG TPA: septal ring lytic transglycosylase RlpA family protein [Coriobacteriia bacterium]|nr:septal ring lytic transglycosylase RlpA family protein [Coriobacteriia bacterium]